MSDEKTKYTDEKTRIENNVTVSVASDKTESKPVEKKRGGLGTAAAGAGVGLVLGAVSSIFTSQAGINSELVDMDEDPDDSFDTPEELDPVEEEIPQPEWADESVAIATEVTDDMSFSEAFATARAEVGPGGAFEWNGMAYGTYTAEEWDSMTPEEKAEYNDKFDWSKIDTSESDVYDGYDDDDEPEYLPPAEEIFVDEDDYLNLDEYESDDYVDDDVEIEVLSTGYDEENDMGYAVLGFDDEVGLLVDIDNDDVYDILVYDSDENGEISDDEMIEIPDGGIHYDELAELDSDYEINELDDDCDIL